jgi:hypothetical protein
VVSGFELLNINFARFRTYGTAKAFSFPLESNLNIDKTAQHQLLAVFENLCPCAGLFRTTFPQIGGNRAQKGLAFHEFN